MADPHTRHTGSITMKRVYVFWWRSEWEDEIPFFDSSTHTHFVSLITLSDFHEFKWNTFIWLLRNPLPKPALPEHVNAFCAWYRLTMSILWHRPNEHFCFIIVISTAVIFFGQMITTTKKERSIEVRSCGPIFVITTTISIDLG